MNLDASVHDVFQIRGAVNLENGRSKWKKRRAESKKRKRFIIVNVSFILIVLIIFSVVAYGRIMDKKTMGSKISVYGLNISGLSLEDAADKISEEFQKTEIVFYEDQEERFKTTVKDLGYTLNKDKLLEALSRIKAGRDENRGLFATNENFKPDYQIQRDDKQEAEIISEICALNAGERVDFVDAYIKYDEEKQEFIIVDEVLGNQIDKERLVDHIHETLDESFGQDLLNDTLTVEIGKPVYQESVTAGTPELKEQLQALNDEIQRYKDMSITYTFGETEETIDSEKLASWLLIDDDGVLVNEEEVQNYVTELSLNYNTMYVTRNFKTSDETVVEISGNEYGFWIDTEEEVQQLLSDINNGQTVRREPVYSKQGLYRNGQDDLVGSYIEVSLDKQHLWLYKDGVLITETDIVSGLPKEDTETYRGAWPIAYKKSPFTLSSDFYGYEVNVEYWMPFVYGQGLHDADWHQTFGGEIYKTNGSHGCINLPPEQARLVYNTIDGGYPIIVY